MDQQKHSPDTWAQTLLAGQDGKLPLQEKLLLAGAKVHNHWVDGDEITEQAFRDGYEAFARHPVGR